MLLVVLATEKPWDQLVIYEPFPEYDAIDSIEGIANYKNTPGLIDEHWTTTYSVRKKADVGLGLPGSGTVSTGMPFWHRFFAQLPPGSQPWANTSAEAVRAQLRRTLVALKAS